jgi:hypothetical protein
MTHLAMLPVVLELWRMALNGKGGHHHDPVCLEKVAQLPGCNKHSIEKFVRLKVPSLRLV